MCQLRSDILSITQSTNPVKNNKSHQRRRLIESREGNRKIIIVFISAVIIVVSTSALMAEITVEEIINKVNENTVKLVDQSYDFSHTFSFREHEYTTTGKKYFKSPDKARVETYQPQEQIVVMKSGTVLVKTPDGRVSPMPMVGINNTISSQLYFNNNTYAVEILNDCNNEINQGKSNESAGLYVIDAEKTGAEKNYEITIDYNMGVVKEFKVLDNEGLVLNKIQNSNFELINGVWIYKTVITVVYSGDHEFIIEENFTNIKVNEGVDDNLFRI